MISRLAPSFLPSAAVLEMTYRCSHRCLFCSCPWEAGTGEMSPHDAELPTAAWKQLIAMLAERGVSTLAFTGGEALLRDDVYELMSFTMSLTVRHLVSTADDVETREAAPRINLLSNGDPVTERTLDFCAEHGIKLSLSLPGLATYAEHVGGGNPDHLLGLFRKAGGKGVKTVVNVAVTRLNLPELYQTLSAAFLAGADEALINRFLPGGRGLKHASRLQLDRAQVVEMLEIAEQALADAGRFGSVGAELPRCVADPERYQRLKVSTKCSAGTGFFVVDPSGYLRVCNHSPVRLVHFSAMDTLKTHPYWRRFAVKDFLPEGCLECPEHVRCDGGCREAAHIVGGSPDSPDPLLADRPPRQCQES